MTSITEHIMAKRIEKESNEVSNILAQTNYTITESMIAPAIRKIGQALKYSGLKKEEIAAFETELKTYLVGKEMKKGDNFKKVIGDAMTKAFETLLINRRNK